MVMQQVNGTLLLVPPQQSLPAHVAEHTARVQRAVWRLRSMQLSRTDMRYMVPDLDLNVTWEEVECELKRLASPSSTMIYFEMNGYPIHGAIVPLGPRVMHLAMCRPPPKPHALRPGSRNEVWVNIGVDGTMRHRASYVHATLAVSDQCDQLASWWVMRGTEKWETVFALAGQAKFDEQLRAAQKTAWVQDGETKHPLFFLLADGKGQVLMSGCRSFKYKGEAGCVCWCCGKNLQQVLEAFGKEKTIDALLSAIILLSAIFRNIPPERRPPDFGLHGVARVTICGLNAMVRIVARTTKKSKPSVAKVIQGILDEDRVISGTMTKGCVIAQRVQGNPKGVLRLEASAAVHFMRAGRFSLVVTACEGLLGPEDATKPCEGVPWNDRCTQWWEAFALWCKYAWQSDFLTGAHLSNLREACVTMGRNHNALRFPKLLWSHLWIDHIYAYARRWRTLSKFSCFIVEGSHRRFKRMLRNSGGISVLKQRSGLQVVVDNHTVDDSLCLVGWDVTSRAAKTQVAIGKNLYWKRHAQNRRIKRSVATEALYRTRARQILKFGGQVREIHHRRGY